MIPGSGVPPQQRELRFVAIERLRSSTLDVQHEMARNCRESGGLDQLCAEMGRSSTYTSKLSEALTGHDGKRPSIEVLIAQLQRQDEAAFELLGKLASIAGAAPPVRARIATDAQVLAALRAELDDSGAIGAALVDRVAKRLGVDVTSVRR